jgi:phage terminase small subunit
MGRPRLPTNVLDARGAFKKDPQRAVARADEPKPAEGDEIGEPPDWFGPEQFMCWQEIVTLAHGGTLSSADRLIVEHGAQLLAMLRAEQWRVHPTIMIRWETVLAKLGMTPSDRSKVAARKAAPNADPLDEFAAAG